MLPERVVAVVPLTVDDRDAPGGCAGLRVLGGRSLVHQVVTLLAESEQVHRVIVATPHEIVGPLRLALGLTSESASGVGDGSIRWVDIQVVSAPECGSGAQLLAILASERSRRASANEFVVIHDPLHPLTSVALVSDVLDALIADPDAAGAVPLGPVTDTLKWVDEGDVITGTADRGAFRTIHSPQAYRCEQLVAALSAADAGQLRVGGPEVLPGLVRAAGGRLRVVPAPAEALRVGDGEGLTRQL